MEEQVLKIMLSKDDWDQDKSSTAKEITALIQSGYIEKDFVIWFNNHYNESGEPGDKIYDYWLNNVKNGR